MDIIGLQIFVTLFLVLGSLILYFFSWKQRDFDHADRLALLPIEEEVVSSPETTLAEASATASEVQQFKPSTKNK